MIGLLGLFASMVAQGQGGFCGPVPLPGAAGPYDYLDQDPQNLWHIRDVNANHLIHIKPDLAGGRVNHALGQIHYILIRIPNHYEAFQWLGKIATKYPGREYDPDQIGAGEELAFPPTVECYYDRAFRYRPNDSNLRLLFAIHYHITDQLDKAIEQYKIAESMRENSPDIQYNLGLAYFDRKEYDLSAVHAQRAYALGYPLPGLRNKLQAVGEWPAASPQ